MRKINDCNEAHVQRSKLVRLGNAPRFSWFYASFRQSLLRAAPIPNVVDRL